MLILMTLIAVVSDYLLHPFYPQFFELRFNVVNPTLVGYYFAAICFIVMIAFPFWAFISKKIAELQILVYTQLIAGLLALYCFFTDVYLEFWITSLIMVFFKGSYLLVYPYILKIVSKEAHANTIGLLSVVVHLGGILGAVFGGLTVDLIHPSYIFIIMAAGDFIQMGISAYLLKSKQFNTAIIKKEEDLSSKTVVPNSFIFKIGLITLVLYFSDFLIRPFFSVYWESLSIFKTKLISGAVYAIPGLVALITLWYNQYKNKEEAYKGIVNALTIGLIGLLLQGYPHEILVIIGRIIYGWAIFQSVVKFDVLLFAHSTPESYAIDYSKIHFFQNLGVLFASLSTGLLVDNLGLQIPFGVAFIGFLITLIAYYLVFIRKSTSVLKTQKV